MKFFHLHSDLPRLLGLLRAPGVSLQLAQFFSFLLGFFTFLLQLHFSQGTSHPIPKLPLCCPGAAEDLHCDGHEDAPTVEDALTHAFVEVFVDIPQS